MSILRRILLLPTKRQWRKWNLPSKIGYVGLIVTALGLVVGLIGLIPIIWPKPQPDPDPPRPYLVPTLVIDSVSNAKVLYHYDVENTGRAPAGEIYDEEFGEAALSVELPPSINLLPRSLDPGAKMRIDSYPLSWALGSGWGFSKTLSLFYCQKSAQATNRYRTEFRFFGSNEYVKPGALLHFGSSKEGLGDRDPDDLVRGTLSLQTGALAFVFCETNGAGEPLIAFTQSTNQFLQIDVPNRVARFWSMTSNGVLLRLMRTIKTNTLHTVAASWDGHSAVFSVDGNMISTNE